MTNTFATMRQDVADWAKCFFLDMPGELRNMIYSLIKEEESITFYSERLEDYSADQLEDDGIDLSKTESNFLGLTQTCRQIRQETAAIYAARTSVRVRYLNLKEYMNKNLPYMARDTNNKFSGNLFVAESSVCQPELGGDWSDVGLTLLLTLCNKNKNLRVQWGSTIGRPNCHVAEDLQNVFETARDTNLGAALVEAVASITLDHFCMVSITFKSDMFHVWVEEQKRVARGTSNFMLVGVDFDFSLQTSLHRQNPLECHI